MMKPMHVLVTGGAGFIGSHLCEALLERGDRVTVLDNFDPFYDPLVKRRNLQAAAGLSGFSLIEGDICDTQLVQAVFKRGFDAVAHLAGLAGVRLSTEQPGRFNEVNVGGTLVLLEAARQHGQPRFIFASTCSVYGLSAQLPHREDDPLLAPVSLYGATKIAGEKYGHVYHQVYGLPLVSLRFFTAYGPRQRPDMAVHKFARQILGGEEVTLYGDGTSSRDYTYVDDLVEGVVAALDSDLSYGVLNLGHSEATQLGKLVKLIEEACERRAEVRHLPDQPGDPAHTCADISLAQKLLGYRPRTPLKEGVARFVEWLKDQPD